MTRLFVLAVAVALVLPGRIWAEARVALVIGNSAYGHTSTLENAGRDAQSVAETLEALGYDVRLHLDLDKARMEDALRRFRRAAQTSEQAIVYYAGHGLELDWQNYLVPTDARVEADLDVPFETVPLDLVLSAAGGARELSLVILDACRNDPFPDRALAGGGTRSLSRGLAPVEPTGNTLVAYAAKEGTVAYDGEGQNSPFTAALVETLRQPGIEISFVFRQIRDKVLAETGGLQEPHIYGSLSAEAIYLNPPDPARIGTAVALPEGDAGVALDIAFWTSVEAGGKVEDYAEYLRRFPTGTFAGLAERRLAALRGLGGVKHRLEEAPPLEDDAAAAWARIEENGTRAEVAAFLERFPESPQAPFALALQTELTRESMAPPGDRALLLDTLDCDRGDFPDERFSFLTGEGGSSTPWIVQNQLARLGFYEGEVDGLFGRGSMAALAAYAKSRGLEDFRDNCTFLQLNVESGLRGEGWGAYVMGLYFKNGRHGLPKDHRLARAWYAYALEDPFWLDRGYRRGYVNLALMLIRGEGGETDYARARELGEKAEEYCLGKNVLALLYRDGLGVERDLARAAALWERALEQCPKRDVFRERLEAVRTAMAE